MKFISNLCSENQTLLSKMLQVAYVCDFFFAVFFNCVVATLPNESCSGAFSAMCLQCIMFMFKLFSRAEISFRRHLFCDERFQG